MSLSRTLTSALRGSAAGCRRSLHTLHAPLRGGYGSSNTGARATATLWPRLLGGAVVAGSILAGWMPVTAEAAGAERQAHTSPSSSSSSSSSSSNDNDSSPPLRVALVQLSVGADKAANLRHAESQIEAAVIDGANMVVLPEMFNCPYANSSFGPYSESMPDAPTTFSSISSSTPSTLAMASVAKRLGIWLVAGSMPERASPTDSSPLHATSGHDFNLFNTCLVFNPDGDLIAKHRKVHLFDIDVPGRMTFKESDTLSAGETPTVFDTPWGRVGLGICYDVRFGEYAHVLMQRGAKMLIFPGAFNMTTGPAHWELLARARAVDNQLWVAVCSPARSKDGKGYQAWGHSSVVSPWGRVVATTEHHPDIVVADVEMSEAEEMRRNIPTSTQKRKDIYQVVDVQAQNKQ